MKTGIRKLALTAHIVFSVGWPGAVAGFLALSIAGLTSPDTDVVRSAYLAMNVVTRFVIVPMSLTAVATGLLQALGTEWGLIRYYWILTKFVLTLFATLVLLMKMKLISYVASVAAGTTLMADQLQQERLELVVHAGGGLLILVLIAAISVFKPWGRTRFVKNEQR